MMPMYNNLLMKEPEANDDYVKKFLSIGEVIIATEPTYIWTVLGSCVSVILYSLRKKVSAICHAQLVEKEFSIKIKHESGTITKSEILKNDYRYLGRAVNHMIDELLSLGIQRNEIVASIYGGGQIIENFQNIGLENAESAVKILQDNNLQIVNKDIAGNKTRTIRYYSDTGVTQVKLIDPIAI
jgi:chemotaxis protein CheD